MEFGLSTEQAQLQDAVDAMLGRVCAVDRLRSGRGSSNFSAWASLVEAGVPGLLIGEENGGRGLGLFEAALIAEKLGKHVAPSPFLSNCVLAPIALRIAGAAEQRRRWLTALASGEARAGVAITEWVSGARDGASLAAADGRLTGSRLFALDAEGADILITVDNEGQLYLVEPDPAFVTVTPMPTIDITRNVSELRFDRAPAQALDASANGAALAAMRDAAWVMLAADDLGAGWSMIDQAVAYSHQRRQFGRAIGTFQAVKHMCATMAAELEPARALIWYAAYAQDEKLADAPLVAAHAKALLGEVGRFVARTATEVHGGIGITDLLGLHYWFKRIGLDRQLFGGPELARRHAARLQGLLAA